MDWAVIAPLAAVVVTAVLGALAVAREQSAIRQLERVTALLEDGDDDFAGRSDLLWLQSALARRVNQQYRAPRKRATLVYGWAMRLAGWGLLLWVYFVISGAIFQVALRDSVGQARMGATWAFIVSIVVLGVLGSAIGAFSLRKRARERSEWLATADPDESHAPLL